MDQLKTQLAAVKQHSFWVMCVGILLVTVGSWWVSTAKLKSEKVTRLGEIEQSFGQLNTISGTPMHANQSVLDGMDARNRKYAQEVAAGWQQQYDQQAGVLVWSTEFSEQFRSAVDKLRPIEAIPVSGNGQVPFSHDLARDLKQEYRDYMEPELPNLAKVIGAKWMVSTFGPDAVGAGGAAPGAMPMPGGSGFGGAGGFGGAAPGGFGGAAPTGVDANGQPIFDDAVVLWDPANQQEILTTHFGFVAKVTLPSTLEVLYAQEDYWVFDNLMRIIREANKIDDKDGKPVYASARHEAVIKRLDYVRIGRSAGVPFGQVNRLGAGPGGEVAGMPGEGGSAAPMTGSTDGAMPGPGGMPGSEGGMGMDAMMARDPAMGRYVDDKYQTLPPERLRGALSSRTPEDALLAVAKRMPVRLRVSIDQRKLNVLLAECGNSQLPVEIRQVRINRAPAPAGSAGGGYGGMGGGFGGGGGGFGSSDSGGGFGGFGGGMPGPGGMGGAMPMPGGGLGGFGGGEGGFGGMGGMGGSGRAGMTPGNLTQDASVDPNLIEVELYGVVYIYNPVNKAQLGLDQPAAGEAGATPATTPAAETPPTEAAAQTPATTPAVVAAPTTGG